MSLNLPANIVQALLAAANPTVENPFVTADDAPGFTITDPQAGSQTIPPSSSTDLDVVGVSGVDAVVLPGPILQIKGNFFVGTGNPAGIDDSESGQPQLYAQYDSGDDSGRVVMWHRPAGTGSWRRHDLLIFGNYQQSTPTAMAAAEAAIPVTVVDQVDDMHPGGSSTTITINTGGYYSVEATIRTNGDAMTGETITARLRKNPSGANTLIDIDVKDGVTEVGNSPVLRISTQVQMVATDQLSLTIAHTDGVSSHDFLVHTFKVVRLGAFQ